MALVLLLVVQASIACGGDDDSRDEVTGPRGMGADLLTPGAVATVVGAPTQAPGRGGGAQGAESELCGDLGTLAVAVMEFRSLTASSNMDDLYAAIEGIETAWQAVERSAEHDEMESAVMLGEAIEELSVAAEGGPEREPIEAAYARLLPPLGEIELAVADLGREAGCP